MVAVDDVNNDTFPDIVFVNGDASSVYVLFGYGNSRFGNVTILSIGTNFRPISLDLGDLNRDTSIDIVVANEMSENIYIFFSYDNRTFSLPTILIRDRYADIDSVAVSDVNGDSIPDILFTDSQANSSISIFHRFGDGNFTLVKVYSPESDTSTGML